MMVLPYIEIPALHLPGGIELHAFGALAAAGIFTGASLAARAARKYGPGDDTPLRDLVTWAVVGGLVGAHLLHVLGYHREMLDQEGWISLFKIWEGVSSMGGVLGALIGIGLFFRTRGLKWTPYLNALALGTAPGWAIARIGCFLAHDHPGIRSTSWFAVNYPVIPYGGPRFDLGLADFVVLAVISAILYTMVTLRKQPDGLLMGVLAVLYSIPRFFLDFLRATDANLFVDGRILGLTPAQWVTPVLTIVGVVLIVRALRMQPGTREAPRTAAARS